MTKVLYTCITGNYDTLIAPRCRQPGFDLICFTDNPELTSDLWRIVAVPKEKDCQKLQRKIKILSHKYLPDYDITFYVDGNMEVKANLNDFMQFFHSGFMTKRHPVRSNIWDEAQACIDKGKARRSDIEHQIGAYTQAGLQPTNLYENGFLVRDRSESTAKLNEVWWQQVETHTHRDQLSLPIAELLSGVKVVTYGKTLFEKYIRIRRHTGKRTPITKVWYSAPADPQKNIGRAYNEFCDLVPGEDDWICLRDQDSLMWPELALKQIEDVLELHGSSYQLLGCVTNRLASTYQRPFPEDYEDPSVLTAYNRALWLHNNRYSEVSDHGRPIAGLFMLFQKKTWLRHPFAEHTYDADRLFSEAVMRSGGRIGLMQGLYVFHYYRFDKPNPGNYVKHLQP